MDVGLYILVYLDKPVKLVNILLITMKFDAYMYFSSEKIYTLFTVL